MTRIRSIHPGFFTDEDLVATSMAARLLFLGLGTLADDKGAFEWKPITIKMRLFPCDSVDIVGELLTLEASGLIRRYKDGDKEYAAIKNFRKFQRPKHPNDVHPMPDDIRIFVGLACPITEKLDAKLEQLPPNGEIAPQMEDGGGRMEEESKDESDDSSLSAEPTGLHTRMVFDQWNSTATAAGLPEARWPLSDARRKAVGARIKQYGLNVVLDELKKIPTHRRFLGPDDATQWRADIGQIMRAETFAGLLEGRYDRQRRARDARQSGGSAVDNALHRVIAREDAAARAQERRGRGELFDASDPAYGEPD